MSCPITFKSFKHHKSLSEETNAFTAKVYFEGRYIGDAKDTGQGGEVDFHENRSAAKADLDAAVAYAKSQTWDYDGVQHNYGGLHDYLAEVAQDMIIANELKNIEKRIGNKLQRDMKTKLVFIDDAKMYSVQFTNYTKALAQLIMRRGPHVVVLNELPLPDALFKYKAWYTNAAHP